MIWYASFRMRALILLFCLPLFAGESSEADRNKLVARQYLEDAWFKGNPELARRFLASSILVSDPRGRQGATEGPDAQVNIIRRWCVVNGDCSKSQILYHLAEGDRVVTAWTFRQKQKRVLTALLAAALGRDPVERSMVSIFRIREGRIVELTSLRDDLGIYSDLGLLNFAVLMLWALGGASGMGLMWLIGRKTRFSPPPSLPE
jgi:hypothetical protein